jgi:hypothetical protein
LSFAFKPSDSRALSAIEIKFYLPANFTFDATNSKFLLKSQHTETTYTTRTITLAADNTAMGNKYTIIHYTWTSADMNTLST